MARPKKKRKLTINPMVYYFKPRGVPMYKLEEITLELDELQALKLADYERLHQTEAASKMKISRPTFGRILTKARIKIADGITTGKAIRIPESPPEKLRGKIKLKCNY
jgi:predicted DNA-binding protein (UPF0251 family)